MVFAHQAEIAGLHAVCKPLQLLFANGFVNIHRFIFGIDITAASLTDQALVCVGDRVCAKTGDSLVFINHLTGRFYIAPCLRCIQIIFVEQSFVVKQHFTRSRDGEQINRILTPLCNFFIHASRHAFFKVGHAYLRVIDIRGKIHQKIFFHVVNGIRREHGYHIRPRAVAHSLHQFCVEFAIWLLFSHHLIFILRGIEGIHHFQQRFLVCVRIGVPQNNLCFFAAGLALRAAGCTGCTLPAAPGKQRCQHGG